MAFDATPSETKTVQPISIAALIDAAPKPDRLWAQAFPDKFLAMMFVAPQACEAVDDLLQA